MQLVSKSPHQTKRFAAQLAHKIASGTSSLPVVIALEGELGAGKTTFVQGFAKALGVTSKVRSPTFLLIKSYKLKNLSYKLLYHVDCYRVRDWRDLVPLEIRSILKDHRNIVLIEWSERVSRLLPAKRVRVHLDHQDARTRHITIS